MVSQAVVVIEDNAAIPGLDDQDQTNNDGENIEYQVSVHRPSNFLTLILFRFAHLMQTYVFWPWHSTQNPLIVRVPISNLPYFNPQNTITVSPQHSSCIGLALIRGIDIARQRLHILTPISPSVIADVNDHGKKIILVSGKFDTPGWAYTEALIRENAGVEDSYENNDEVDKFPNIPWVEKLKGSQGRGGGARVWRVRRDLGKSDGGD